MNRQWETLRVWWHWFLYSTPASSAPYFLCRVWRLAINRLRQDRNWFTASRSHIRGSSIGESCSIRLPSRSWRLVHFKKSIIVNDCDSNNGNRPLLGFLVPSMKSLTWTALTGSNIKVDMGVTSLAVALVILIASANGTIFSVLIKLVRILNTNATTSCWIECRDRDYSHRRPHHFRWLAVVIQSQFQHRQKLAAWSARPRSFAGDLEAKPQYRRKGTRHNGTDWSSWVWRKQKCDMSPITWTT